MSKKIFLATHTDLDGIGCAVLAYLAFGQDNVDVEYCDYKDVDEKVEKTIESELFERTYDKIFITDISVGEKVANMIEYEAKRLDVVLLDHHATAIYLNDYEWANVRVTDKGGVKTSGTMMFYRYLEREGYFDDTFTNNQLKNTARFAEVVRDYDTWRWKELGDEGIVCKQLNDLFHIYGRDIFVSEWAMNNILGRVDFPHFDYTDTLLLENKQKDIDIYISQKNKQLMTVKDNFGYTCGVVFAERHFSELGNKLSELHPELDYIAMIDMGFGGVSYRTVKDDIDLGGEIAHSFGGGGHRKAAGSTFDGIGVRGVVINQIIGLGDEIIS